MCAFLFQVVSSLHLPQLWHVRVYFYLNLSHFFLADIFQGSSLAPLKYKNIL